MGFSTVYKRTTLASRFVFNVLFSFFADVNLFLVSQLYMKLSKTAKALNDRCVI